MESVEFWFAMAATAAFAVTAVLAVADRDIDLFGITVLGVITAIGGGTIRDVILEVPVFWAADLSYIWLALGASLAAFWAQSFFARHRIHSLMLYLDGFGAAMFGVEATGKVWDLSFGLPVAPVVLGIVTAIRGGLIRDVLAGRRTLIMTRELYAIPVLLGCTLFMIVLTYFPEYRLLGSICCILLIFGLRAAAIHWNLTVPDWLATNKT